MSRHKTSRKTNTSSNPGEIVWHYYTFSNFEAESLSENMKGLTSFFSSLYFRQSVNKVSISGTRHKVCKKYVCHNFIFYIASPTEKWSETKKNIFVLVYYTKRKEIQLYHEPWVVLNIRRQVIYLIENSDR